MRLEAAGVDSLWVSDHVVQPVEIRSAYPYSSDGRAEWDPAVPQLEALVALAAVAAVTKRVELGTAVLVLPQRQPVLLAKQLASLDALAPGRLALGVGAGWLAEEFQALGADFSARGAAMDEWIDVLRACWTGRPERLALPHVELPAGLVVEPSPGDAIPVLVGGMSAPAARRVARRGDGWIAQASCDPAGAAAVLASLDRVLTETELAGRDPAALRVVARLSGAPTDLPAVLAPLAAAGVDDVVLDDPGAGAAEAIARAREAAGS